MPAPVIVSTVTTLTLGTNAPDGTYPTGLVAGDVVLHVVAGANGGSRNVFSQGGLGSPIFTFGDFNAPEFAVWAELQADGSKSGTAITYACTDTASIRTFLSRMTGASLSGIVQQANAADFVSVGTEDSPSINTTVADSLLVFLIGANAASDADDFAGTVAIGGGAAIASAGHHQFSGGFAIASQAQASIGASGTRTWTHPFANASEIAATMAFGPASAGGRVLAPMSVPRTRWID
jgi:hypothetical protein